MSSLRRVYMLAPDLFSRIEEFRLMAGMSSEVEAVRALLDFGLVGQENSRALQERASKILAAGGDPRRMLALHSLVKRVSALDGSITTGRIEVECVDGHVFTLAPRAA